MPASRYDPGEGEGEDRQTQTLRVVANDSISDPVVINIIILLLRARGCVRGVEVPHCTVRCGIGVCIGAGVLAFEPVRQRSAFRRMRRVRAAAAAAAALVEQGCVDHLVLELVETSGFQCMHRCSCHARVENASIAQRRELGPRADSVGVSGVWLCASSSSLFPPFPPFSPAFVLFLPLTSPSSLFQIITLTLGMLGRKYVRIYEKWSWIPTAITFLSFWGARRSICMLVLFCMFCVFCVLCATSPLPFLRFVLKANPPPTAAKPKPPTSSSSWASSSASRSDGCRSRVTTTCSVPARGDAGVEDVCVDVSGPRPRTTPGNFAKFCMVLLVLSVVANNIINVYSMGLSISVIGVWLAKVRGLSGQLLSPLSTCPSPSRIPTPSPPPRGLYELLGYWLSIFVVVVLLEHFVFRKGEAPLEHRGDYIGQIVVGSANPFGGDIGFQLSGVFTGIFYLPARYLELKYIG
ncbi:hypothetical protein B0H13DRAFT_2519661 [Mycena leptocephala]|nr:hypothetical protein B0H13DRAFT_2519661 [Mycena leptocephala]